MTSDEIVEVKTGIEILRSSISRMSDAQAENTKAQTQVSKQLNDLTLELRERDVRDEYLKKEVVHIREHQTRFEEFARPVISRSKKTQERADKFYDSLFGNWGKIFSLVILIGIMYAIGLDPTKMFK